mgnify:CR=1 FL=1
MAFFGKFFEAFVTAKTATRLTTIPKGEPFSPGASAASRDHPGPDTAKAPKPAGHPGFPQAAQPLVYSIFKE